MDDLLSPVQDGVAATATPAGATVSIAALFASGRDSSVLYVWNTSTQLVRVRIGAAAGALSFPVAPNEIAPFAVGTANVVGLWCASGTAAVELHCGGGL